MPYSLKQQEIHHAILLSAGTILFVFTDQMYWLLVLASVSFLILLYANHLAILSIKPVGGYANWVTLFRLGLLLAVGYWNQNLDTNWIGGLGILILSLDGIDGFLARKFNQTSEFGGRLDGETDAYFVLQYACILHHYDFFEWWILWPGVLRYGYVLISYIIWKTLKPEPVSYIRKTIAVIIMAALLSPFLIGSEISGSIVIVAIIAVTFSFGKSFLYQIKNH